ncbi:unnamed protein product [Protopolystoma xenopodis]|uniref:Uncharacterized protein n=1 Tax=Protopolystoma xenopodis TaxID=117903 RepID=A0A448XP17_9PLAT|nr:unnamed protein product [Protopolystoma xenopodis]
MVKLTDDADYDAGETSGNVPRSGSNFGLRATYPAFIRVNRICEYMSSMDANTCQGYAINCLGTVVFILSNPVSLLHQSVSICRGRPKHIVLKVTTATPMALPPIEYHSCLKPLIVASEASSIPKQFQP